MTIYNYVPPRIDNTELSQWVASFYERWKKAEWNKTEKQSRTEVS